MVTMHFDETLHPRRGDGMFTDKAQSAPELNLHTVEPMAQEFDYHLGRLDYAGDSRPAIDWHVDPEDVAPNLGAFGVWVDMFASSIDEGHLSRGVAGRQRTAVARAWIEDASTVANYGNTELAEFRDGLRRGVVGLYYEKVVYDGPLHALDGSELEDAANRALVIAETKRASKEERETWRQNLQHATTAEHRGMLVAAAALSGTDGWWGFRVRARDVMTGDI